MNTLRLLTTAEQREWLVLAKERGGLCASCGRALGDGEPVYVEAVEVVLNPAVNWSRKTVKRAANLGSECASQEFVERAAHLPIDPCEGCGRPIFRGIDHAGRSQNVCSKRCTNLKKARERQAERDW